jgi:hypothetical protein
VIWEEWFLSSLTGLFVLAELDPTDKSAGYYLSSSGLWDFLSVARRVCGRFYPLVVGGFVCLRTWEFCMALSGLWEFLFVAHLGSSPAGDR